MKYLLVLMTIFLTACASTFSPMFEPSRTGTPPATRADVPPAAVVGPTRPDVVVADLDAGLGRITRGYALNDEIRQATDALLKAKKLQPAQARNARHLADVARSALDHAKQMYVQGKPVETTIALNRADAIHREAQLQNTLTQDKPSK